MTMVWTLETFEERRGDQTSGDHTRGETLFTQKKVKKKRGTGGNRRPKKETRKTGGGIPNSETGVWMKKPMGIKTREGKNRNPVVKRKKGTKNHIKTNGTPAKGLNTPGLGKTISTTKTVKEVITRMDREKAEDR